MSDGPSLGDIVELANPAMVVVTGRYAGESVGCLVGFHSQVSIEPPRWGVWISKANHSHDVLVRATSLAVHVLGQDQHDLAAHFGGLTGDDVDKFVDVALDPPDTWPHGPADERPPLLRACPTRIVGWRRAVLTDDTDHSCIVIEPVTVAIAPDGTTPLRYRAADDIEPGHPASDG